MYLAWLNVRTVLTLTGGSDDGDDEGGAVMGLPKFEVWNLVISLGVL